MVHRHQGCHKKHSKLKVKLFSHSENMFKEYVPIFCDSGMQRFEMLSHDPPSLNATLPYRHYLVTPAQASYDALAQSLLILLKHRLHCVSDASEQPVVAVSAALGIQIRMPLFCNVQTAQ